MTPRTIQNINKISSAIEYRNNSLKLSRKLFEDGFFVNAIRPPTVPPNTARLRFTLSADHNFQQIELLLEKVKDVMA